MKFHTSLSVIIMGYCLTSGANTLILDSVHPRDLERRDDPHDRGTFIMFCAGRDADHKPAYGACNNACYSINCINSHDPNANLMRIGQDTSMHRFWSGCQTGSGGSVKKYSPFSQLFVDLVGLDPDKTDCDEWPMADTEQSPPDGRQPNNLRLMPSSENEAAGGQYSSFKNNDAPSGGQTKRKGTGTVAYPDYFRVEFNTDNMSEDDKKKYVPYCQAKAGEPSCDNDGKQFFMSVPQGEKGTLSDPYNWDTNNHYRLSETGKLPFGDIRQCSIDLQRDSGSPFWEIYVYNVPFAMSQDAKEIGSFKGNMGKGEQITVKGGPQWIDITNVDDAPADDDGVTKTKLKFDADASGLPQGLSWDTSKWCEPFKLVKGKASQEGWHCDFPCIEQKGPDDVAGKLGSSLLSGLEG